MTAEDVLQTVSGGPPDRPIRLDRPVRIAALTINWNGARDTLELVESLARQRTDDLLVDAYIVDNASEGEDVRLLKDGLDGAAQGMRVRLLRNERNVGVPAAYNQAIASAGLDYDCYLRLDNDVVLLEGALPTLCGALLRKRGEGVRLVGGNVRYYDAPSEDNGGAVSIDLLRIKTSVSYPREDTVCDGVLGCVMLVDREVVRAFSPQVFFEWLFLSTDESELSLRCSAAGWRTYYASQTLALHKGGRSTSKVRRLSGAYGVRNWAFLSLHYMRPKILAPVVLLRLAALAAYKIAGGDGWVARAILEGVATAFRGVASGRT